MRSNDVTANGLADVVGLPRCPLNATRTLRMIENLIRVLMWFITDAYSSFVFFEILSANRLCCMYNVYNQDPNPQYLTLDHEQNLTNSTLYKYKQSLLPKV